MKARLTLICCALTVLLGAMVWIVNDRSGVAAVPAIAVESIPAPMASPAAPGTAPVPATSPASLRDPVARASIDASGEVTYVARAGDTVSDLAAAMLGSGSKANRNAVIAASPALGSNPDRVLEGQSYSVAAAAPRGDDAGDRPSADAAGLASRNGTNGTKDAPHVSVAAGGPSLEYTAQAGDTVRGLATDLLGGDTKANRRGIVAGNASLRENPDQLVAGQSYTIVARNGLAAGPEAPPVKAPTSQPDADEAARLSVGRMLGYTARTGDTVSKLATVLLGSDTRANRDLIVGSNFSLKQDPDRLVAGVTYWIPAPVRDAKP